MRVDDIDLEFSIDRQPIQALGTIGGRGFYFIAKHSSWSFEVADDCGSLPSDTGNNPVFRVEGRFPSVDDVPDGHVAMIVEHCARLFTRIGRT